MIITDSDEAPVVPTPVTIKITAPEYRGVTVDTRYIPSSNLLTHIDGASWTADEYFSQKLDIDNTVQGQRLNSSGLYQQYILIKGMELKVTSPLLPTQESESNGWLAVGTANVYPFLIPNVGDMFRANIGDGRLGIFQLTRVEKKSIYKEACHEIEYALIEYDTLERMADLRSKVVETVIYVKDFLYHGQNPLLHEEEFNLFSVLSEREIEITQDYFRSFFSHEYKTLLLPGQGKKIYDSFLTSTLVKMFTTWDAPELRELRLLNVDGDQYMKTRNVWEMLFKRDIDLMPLMATEMGMVGAKSFTRDPMLEGVYHSGIDYVIYPKNPVITLDYELRPQTKPLAPLSLVAAPGRTRRLKDSIPATELPGNPTTLPPLIHPILKDDCYVFTQAFYDETEGQSQLELAVSDHLLKKAPSNKLLLEFCDNYKSWGLLEMFYYVPAILILLRASLRRI